MESKVPQLKAQIDQRLAEAIAPHPWFLNAMDHGVPPDLAGLDPVELLAAFSSMFAALVDCVVLVAAEVERQDASRQ